MHRRQHHKTRSQPPSHEDMVTSLARFLHVVGWRNSLEFPTQSVPGSRPEPGRSQQDSGGLCREECKEGNDMDREVDVRTSWRDDRESSQYPDIS